MTPGPHWHTCAASLQDLSEGAAASAPRPETARHAEQLLQELGIEGQPANTPWTQQDATARAHPQSGFRHSESLSHDSMLKAEMLIRLNRTVLQGGEPSARSSETCSASLMSEVHWTVSFQRTKIQSPSIFMNHKP